MSNQIKNLVIFIFIPKMKSSNCIKQVNTNNNYHSLMNDRNRFIIFCCRFNQAFNNFNNNKMDINEMNE